MYSNDYLSFSALQPAGPKAGSAAAAQAQDSQPSQGGAQPQSPPPSLGMAVFLPLLILVPFFFLSSRRQKKEQAERSKLKRGDKVLSNAGLVGELVEMDERFAKVKLAPGITVQMLSSTIGPLDTADASAPASEKKEKDALQDLKDAKTAEKSSAAAK